MVGNILPASLLIRDPMRYIHIQNRYIALKNKPIKVNLSKAMHLNFQLPKLNTSHSLFIFWLCRWLRDNFLVHLFINIYWIMYTYWILYTERICTFIYCSHSQRYKICLLIRYLFEFLALFFFNIINKKDDDARLWIQY